MRDDEVGGLARSLVRLERDGLKKLGELRTLLETSNAVVRSLEVRITAERRDDTVIVSVLDNGPGIDPDELSHVFERFYRARHGRQQHSGGTGLGLAICKAFIEAHGGTIWAESSMHGTTISFSLPLVPPTTSAMSVDTAATKLSRVEPL